MDESIRGVIELLLLIGGTIAGAISVRAVMREKIRSLEEWRKEKEVELSSIRDQLSKGGARFAVLTEKVDSILTAMTEMKEVLQNAYAPPPQVSQLEPAAPAPKRESKPRSKR